MPFTPTSAGILKCAFPRQKILQHFEKYCSSFCSPGIMNKGNHISRHKGNSLQIHACLESSRDGKGDRSCTLELTALSSTAPSRAAHPVSPAPAQPTARCGCRFVLQGEYEQTLCTGFTEHSPSPSLTPSLCGCKYNVSICLHLSHKLLLC